MGFFSKARKRLKKATKSVAKVQKSVVKTVTPKAVYKPASRVTKAVSKPVIQFHKAHDITNRSSFVRRHDKEIALGAAGAATIGFGGPAILTAMSANTGIAGGLSAFAVAEGKKELEYQKRRAKEELTNRVMQEKNKYLGDFDPRNPESIVGLFERMYAPPTHPQNVSVAESTAARFPVTPTDAMYGRSRNTGFVGPARTVAASVPAVGATQCASSSTGNETIDMVGLTLLVGLTMAPLLYVGVKHFVSHKIDKWFHHG